MYPTIVIQYDMFGFGRHRRLPELRGRLLTIELAALVALSGAATVSFLYDERPGGALNPTPLLHVSEIGWTTSGQVLSSGPGARFVAGSHPTLTLVMTNAGGSTIAFTSATTNATGFSVISSDLPPVPGGSSENLTVTLSTPTSAYAGPLWVDLE